MSDRLIALRVARRFVADETGTYELPPGHLFGMRVPVGGSACSKCNFLSEEGTHCGNEYFIGWQKSLDVREPGRLPTDADHYCCDVFESAKDQPASYGK